MTTFHTLKVIKLMRYTFFQSCTSYVFCNVYTYTCTLSILIYIMVTFVILVLEYLLYLIVYIINNLKLLILKF